MAEKILVVDDEIALQETVSYNLVKQGYDVVVAGDGPTALALARKELPDLIVLDLMLPGMDGLEVCRVLRKEMNTPVIMLTARDDEIDRVVGLEVGADDYLTKPFSMRELLARVKAMLRRVRLLKEEMAPVPVQDTQLIQFGDFEINLSRREVQQNHKTIPMQPREYDLLVFLASHPGRVFNRETILADVWGWDYTGESRTVDVHIRWLREKIEVDPTQPIHLVTVRGAGYRFEG
jgi:DNA-binding response OmpR family regulator